MSASIAGMEEVWFAVRFAQRRITCAVLAFVQFLTSHSSVRTMETVPPAACRRNLAALRFDVRLVRMRFVRTACPTIV